MKLSLALSALLVGGSLFMSGCDSSSSDPAAVAQEVVDNIDENVTDIINQLDDAVTAPKFTTEMLGGKTFYSYGYWDENNVFETENRFIAEFSNDTNSVTIHNHPDNNDTFNVTANNSIITDTKGRSAIKWQLDGMSDLEFALLKVFDDKSFMTLSTDPEHPDPYPQLFSVSQTTDKGQTLYDEFMAEQVISKDSLGANPWYSLDWSDLNWNDDGISGDIMCHALITYNSENSMDYEYILDDGTKDTHTNIGSYVVSDNKLVVTGPQDGETVTDTLTPILVSKDTIIFDGKTAMFKNRDDAISFINMMTGSTDGGCASKNFPE